MSDYADPWLASRPERTDLPQVVWRLRTPSRQTLTCALYPLEFGVDVRAFYAEDDLVQSFLMPTWDSARGKAEEMKAAVLGTGGRFRDVTTA